MIKSETQNQKVIQEKVLFLAQKTGKIEAEIRGLMEIEKTKRPLFSEYGTLLAVAKNVNIDLSESDPIPELDKISNVTEKKSINLVGRIKNIYPIKSGIGKKGNKWKFRAGVISDGITDIPILVTDGPTTNAFITNAKHNDIVIFINAFGSINERQIEGQEPIKTLELKVNRNSSVKINPTGYGKNIPLFEEYHKVVPTATIKDLNDIAELEIIPMSVNIQSMITKTPERREGIRPDNSVWVKLSFTIGESCDANDNTFIKVSVWGEKIIPDLGKGDIIEIKNGYVKFQNGRPQINVGKYATLSVVKKK